MPTMISVASRATAATLLAGATAFAGPPESIQVNIDGGATKAGVAPDEALALAREVARLPRLALRGLERALEESDWTLRERRDQREPHYAYAPSAEHREGLAAFNEKRAPRFTGH